jgi:trigger factor
MQVKIEDVSPVEKKLVVEVPWPTVGSKLDEAYRELSKSVHLKGFRKGKVPRNVLERMFGKRVRAEVAVQLVRESFVTAVTQHQLDAVSEPRVDSSLDIASGQPFAFEAIVEVRGEVVAKDYQGFALTKRPLVVEDQAVDAALEHLRREQTELRPIEGREVLDSDDIVVLAIKGTVGEHAIDRPQVTFDLGDAEHEPLPGLCRAVVGLPIKAEHHGLEIAIPADHPDSAIAGQTAKLVVSVLDARAKDVPALDDELAKDTGRAESLAELREVLRKEIGERMAEDIRDEVRNAALKELVVRNQIPVASSLVERAIEAKYSRFQRMLGMQPGQAGALSDELRESLRPGATDEVRGQLLLESVADQEKIEISEGEVDERVAKLAKMGQQQTGRLKADMDRDGRLENLRFQIRQERTLDFLVDKATVSEKAPEPETAAAAAPAP